MMARCMLLGLWTKILLLLALQSVDSTTVHKIKAVVGKSANLPCDTTELSNRLTWHRNDTGDAIVGKSVTSTTFLGQYEGRLALEGTKLVIKKVNGNDSALYYCSKTDKNGKTKLINFVQLIVDEESKEINYMKITATTGDSVTLPCDTNLKNVQGTNWYRNDSMYSITSRPEYNGRVKMEGNNLILTDVGVKDKAFYYCVSTRRSYGPVIGTLVKLVVEDVNFHEISAIVGTTITLPCVTNHKEYRITEWYRNDSSTEIVEMQYFKIQKHLNYVHTNYTGRVEFDGKNLILTSCKVKDTALYYCKTINDANEVQEGHSFIKLFVVERPSCGETAATISTLNGTSTLLPCIVRGNPPPDVKWFKVGNPTKKLGTRFVVTRKGLLINAVEREDSGRYQVTLENGHTYTFITELDVKSATEVKPENYKSTVESDRVMLPCGTFPVVTGRDTVSWERKGRSVGQTDDDRFMVYPLNGSLAINSVSRDDEGWYTCIIFSKDEYSGVSRKIKMFLSVMYPPVIFNILEKQYVFVKKSIVLPCSSTGNPGVTYRWLLPNGQEIRNNEKYHISTNGSLIVKNVEIDDEKNYTCAPFNTIGDGKSKQTQLIVLLAPKFLNPAKSEMVVDKQGNITLDCSSSGFPKPNVTWQHNGGDLKDISRVVFDKTGFLKLTNAVGDDTGTYTCSVESIAGKLSRSIELVVRGKPGTPFKPEVRLSDEIAYVKWTRSYNGGSTQTFEIWVRDSSEDDYTGWKIEPDSKSKEDNKNSNDENEEHDFYLNKLIEPTGGKVTYFFSVRALNEHGYSGFSKVVKLVTDTKPVTGSMVPQYIIAKPLPPFDVFLNITKNGYVLQWKIKDVPGRPLASKISIQYRETNSDGPWKELRRVDVRGAPSRKRRSLGGGGGSSGVIIQQNELGSNKLQEFQVVSVSSDGAQSASQEPKVTFVANPAMPLGAGENTNPIIPVVLGAIFGVFIVVLLISLYCFCRKRKQNRYAASKNERKVITYTKENGAHMDTSRDIEDGIDEADDTQLLSEYDSPKHYHLRTCPALKLGQYSTNGTPSKNGSNNKDQVYILLQQYKEEKELCTCNKHFLTLNSRDQKTKRDKKKGIYKSNSSPSILLTSDQDGSSIDPSDLLDEEDYDLSDNERDEVGELNKDKYPTLNRQNFKDSYDQFCRDGSTSKDSRTRLSSEEKTEADKSLEQNNVGKDINDDASSENSATESERVLTPKEKGVMDNRRSFDGKSSGYGEGSNSTSDSESVQELKKPSVRANPYALGYISDTGARRDYGYASDISTRSSPLDYKGRPKYQPPSQRHAPRMGGYEPPMMGNYFSEDESIRSGHSGIRPMQPPPYNQALHDIERLSEKNDITDSEEMYDHLLDIGRQLGVSLEDSVESDLNTKHMTLPTRSYSNPRSFPPPPAMESGYMTDTSLGGKDRYTDREKSERCAQLLNEFKSTRSNINGLSGGDSQFDEEEVPVEPPSIRSKSVMDNMTFEEPRVPPALRRSNSVGASGVYKEWLV